MCGLKQGNETFTNDNLLNGRDNAFKRFDEFLNEIIDSHSEVYISADDAHKKVWELMFPPEVMALKIPKNTSSKPCGDEQKLSLDFGITTKKLVNKNYEQSKVFLSETETFYEVNIRLYDIGQFIRITLNSRLALESDNSDVSRIESKCLIHGIEFGDLRPKYLNGLLKEVEIYKQYDKSEDYKSNLINFNNHILQKQGMILPTPYSFATSIQDILDSI
jgi:hypothetical protein